LAREVRGHDVVAYTDAEHGCQCILPWMCIMWS